MNRKLKDLLEKELEAYPSLNIDTASTIYKDVFRVVRDLVRSETHKHDLTKKQINIRILGLGRFTTKRRHNEKERGIYKRKRKRMKEQEDNNNTTNIQKKKEDE